MSIVKQLRMSFSRFCEVLSRYNVDLDELRESLRKLEFLEKELLYPQILVNRIRELSSTVSMLLTVFDDTINMDKLRNSVSSLSKTLNTFIETGFRGSFRLRILYTFTILTITLANTTSILLSQKEDLYAFSLAIVTISVALLFGVYARLYTSLLLLPLLPLTSILPLAMIASSRMGIETLAILLINIAALVFLTKFLLSMMQDYRKLVIEIINIGSNIERFINNINAVEMKTLAKSRELYEIYSRVYGDMTNELIRYIEEVSRIQNTLR